MTNQVKGRPQRTGSRHSLTRRFERSSSGSFSAKYSKFVTILSAHTHTHTHNHFYGSSGFCPGLPRWAGRKV